MNLISHYIYNAVATYKSHYLTNWHWRTSKVVYTQNISQLHKQIAG